MVQILEAAVAACTAKAVLQSLDDNFLMLSPLFRLSLRKSSVRVLSGQRIVMVLRKSTPYSDNILYAYYEV
jgi:hypothetical protein